jgi:hypothetical protein
MDGSPPSFLGWLLQIAVAVSLACCIWSNVYRELFDIKTSNNRKGEALWEAFIADSTPPGQGIFFKYEFGDRGENAAFAQTIYFLGVYRVYPRRVLVADPAVMINDGHNILKNNTYPSDPWLREQGISSVLSVIMSARQNLPYVKSVRRVQ